LTNFTVGTLAVIPITFPDAEPDTLVFKVERYVPIGTIATYTYGVDAAVVHDGVGAYHLEYLVESSGSYVWRAEATGAVERAVEGTFTASTFFPPPSP
jgi:hypothetical protein